MKGTIRWFDEQKGCGHIQTEDGMDLLAHQSDIALMGFTSLYEKDEVEFEIIRDTKGHLKAVNVRKI